MVSNQIKIVGIIIERNRKNDVAFDKINVLSDLSVATESTSFYFDDGVAVWPAQVVNYTNKTQFLFRISKGVLDVNDEAVNDSFAPDEIRVPFRNMIYLGDSDTDIPCMKLVNSQGGYSVGVFNPDEKDELKAKNKVYKMMRDNRISYFAPADYSEGSELDELVKLIIDKTVYNEKLYEKNYNNQKEAIEQAKPKEEQEKLDLINSLESSGSFKNTHAIVEKLSKYTSWEHEELEDLLQIALENTQVWHILNDPDIQQILSKIRLLIGENIRMHYCFRKNLTIDMFENSQDLYGI